MKAQLKLKKETKNITGSYSVMNQKKKKPGRWVENQRSQLTCGIK